MSNASRSSLVPLQTHSSRRPRWSIVRLRPGQLGVPRGIQPRQGRLHLAWRSGMANPLAVAPHQPGSLGDSVCRRLDPVERVGFDFVHQRSVLSVMSRRSRTMLPSLWSAPLEVDRDHPLI